MSERKRIKSIFGDRYIYKRYLSAGRVKALLNSKKCKHEKLVASLTVGCVKINAVIYPTVTDMVLAYDILVKDTPDCAEWICYDTLTEPVRYKSINFEQVMFRVLDDEVKEYGLSYTECNFEKLDGKNINKK